MKSDVKFSTPTGCATHKSRVASAQSIPARFLGQSSLAILRGGVALIGDPSSEIVPPCKEARVQRVRVQAVIIRVDGTLDRLARRRSWNPSQTRRIRFCLAGSLAWDRPVYFDY